VEDEEEVRGDEVPSDFRVSIDESMEVEDGDEF
jgi:hypothetical protein